jgi:thiol-disulfide isomerase/thioredoxin
VLEDANMINHFKRCFLLLLFTFWPWSAQPLAAQEINYKLVPNLQPMNDSSPARDFTLPDASGNKLSLKDFRGKVVLLNFWASWCVPCREEMPAMERLYQEFQNQGLIILGVNVREKREDALAFLKELKVTYPVVFDPTGRWLLAYGAWGLPNTYLIGPQGEGLARTSGHADWYSPGARALIQALLNQNKK